MEDKGQNTNKFIRFIVDLLIDVMTKLDNFSEMIPYEKLVHYNNYSTPLSSMHVYQYTCSTEEILL